MPKRFEMRLAGTESASEVAVDRPPRRHLLGPLTDEPALRAGLLAMVDTYLRANEFRGCHLLN
jgi:hypothetical protein